MSLDLRSALVLVLALAWHCPARAEPCSEELRDLQALGQLVREQVVAGKPAAAIALASQYNLEQPVGYDHENSVSCQKWAREAASARRASCSFEAAREQLRSIKTEQPFAIDAIRKAQEGLTHASRVPFTCRDKKDLYLICQPASYATPDAWCARRVDQDDTLEFPRGAWCKLVDGNGVEVSPLSDGYEPTCREDAVVQKSASRSRVREQRRASVATAGTGIALLAAMAIPVSYVPEGFAKLLRRLGALDKGGGKRLHRHSALARQRYLPLIATTALSVSSLSSRFWWAGILAASCGVTGDVMLAQHWQQHDRTRRAIGIASVSVGAVAGLLLNLETLGWSDTGTRFAFLPTLSIGVAEAELGVAGRF